MSKKTFTLTSADLGGQATSIQEFNGWGCTGDNLSPELSWHNAPAGTKSFAVTMYDPDAPTGSGFWHWLVFDIKADVSQLASGAGSDGGNMPDGCIQSLNDYGIKQYGGPCPPEGRYHGYILTVHALDVDTLGLSADTNPAVVGFNLGAHTLAKATLVAYFKR